jgi:hypothetical protein
MKTNFCKNHLPLLMGIIVAACLQMPFKAKSQIFAYGNPANPENYVASSGDILNTGCDIRQTRTVGRSWAVAVCDGSTPTFSWWLVNNGVANAIRFAPIVGVPGGGAITDPDVVLSSDGLFAIIIYIQNTHCYFESWRWNAATSSFVINQYATMLSNSRNVANYTNIDIAKSTVDNIDYVAATWTEQTGFPTTLSTVIGAVGTFNASSSQFVFSTRRVNVTSGTDSYQPDVCINGTKYSTLKNYVTFTYIQGNPNGNHGLYYRADTWDDLNTGGSGFSAQVLLKSGTYPGSFLSKPRIAASGAGIWQQTDFEIVVENFTKVPFASKILGFNRCLGVNKPEVFINGSPDISTVYNGIPVVTYIGDEIVVAWSYGGGIHGNVPNDILSRQLYAGGTNSGTVKSNNTTFYSVANNTLTNNQDIPSIAGKYSSGNFTLYVWDDPTTLYEKTSYDLNTSLKLSADNETDSTEITEPKFYPNPVSSELTMDLGNDDTWIGAVAEIYNIEGKLMNKYNIEDLSARYNLSELDNGLYFVKVVKDDQVITKKILIQH